MPGPIGAGGVAAIYGATALTTAGINAYSQGKTNKHTRRNNEMMYARQLADNVELWKMNNEYNSPKEQMKRLKEAGLNPNLVYGDGATAMSRSQPSGADMKQWNPDAPKIEGNPIGDAVLKYNDLKQQNQQIDNLKNQNLTETKRQALTDAQTQATLKQAGYTDQQIQALIQDIEQKSKLNPISLQAAGLNVQKTEHEIGKIMADTEYTRDQNRRAEITLQDHLKTTSLGRNKTAEEIKEISQKIINLKLTASEAEFEVYLNSLGLTKHDNAMIRGLELRQVPYENRKYTQSSKRKDDRRGNQIKGGKYGSAFK